LRPSMGVATSFAAGTGATCGVRRDVERLRVQETDSPPDWWGMKRDGAIGAGPGADDATLVDSSAAMSSASDTSDTETVREREELVGTAADAPQRSRAVLVVAVVTSQPIPAPVPPPLPLPPPGSPASLLASSMPSTLMLLRRPLRRSRSMPCHISSVTPKRSRHLRSWRARESGRVSGLWHMAQGEGCPPCLAVLLR
jgi:hypothetical protein